MNQFDRAGISVLWLFLFGYVIIASVDYGAGFFNAYSLLTGKQHIVSKVIKRYLSPVWEVTNVFFVFFFVGIVGFFPETAFYFGTILLVPGSIALILLAIRGSYYAFESYGTQGHRGYAFMYGASGILIPASLSIVLTIAAGGFVSVDNGQPSLDYLGLFLSPLTWSIVVLSIIAVINNKRTRKGETSKYSASPPQTPSKIRSSCDLPFWIKSLRSLTSMELSWLRRY